MNIEKEAELENNAFFASNHDGSYIALGNPNKTQYEGWFIFKKKEWEMYKLLEDVKTSGKINLYNNSLILSIKQKETTYLSLDFRETHNYDSAGRIYSIYIVQDPLDKHEKILIIKYTKYESYNLTNPRSPVFLAISGMKNHNYLEHWERREYAYDSKRGIKNDFYVNTGLTLDSEEGKTIVFSYGTTEEEAINENKKTRKLPEDTAAHFPARKPLKSTAIAKEALNNLTLQIDAQEIHGRNSRGTGILAGLPWFFQIWGRDELISSIGLLHQKKYKEIKSILIRQLQSVDETGKLPNKWPPSELGSADGAGWLYKRVLDVINEEKKTGKKIFTKNNKQLAYSKVCLSIQNNEKRMQNGLIQNGPLETWMDTSDKEGSDTRQGARVEVQALHLCMLKTARILAEIIGEKNLQEYILKESDFKKTVLKKIFNAGLLADGFHENKIDNTARPNIFLANYIYPELLEKNDWISTFDFVMQECWLDWGGISSISKQSPLFKGNHTGITNESYHRGDSWYFLNNIAAICMHRVDKELYKDKIKSIKDASVNEMLNKGWPGQCAELSSANTQTSEGCLAQAWSAATLIELLEETNTKKESKQKRTKKD